MGHYAKKTMTGTYKIIEGGRENPEADYYIAEADEIERMRNQVYRAHQTVEKYKTETAKRVKEAYADARSQVTEIQENLNKEYQAAKSEFDKQLSEMNKQVSDLKSQIADLTAQLDKATADLATERDLQKNLIRICKERANQQRGLKPKKEHDGYIVLESTQYTDHYKQDIWAPGTNSANYTSPDKRKYAKANGLLKTETAEKTVWKSILQTPYDASIPLADIQSKVEDDLWTGKDVLLSVACPKMTKTSGDFYDFGQDDAGNPITGLYRWKYRANFRQGLWELEIYTTGPLTVPDFRRPETGKQKGKVNGEGKKQEQQKKNPDNKGKEEENAPDKDAEQG